MPYIGKSTTIGVRQRYMYTATASQTTFSGTDAQNLTLNYTDSNFVDVYLNGVLLKTGTDYTATSGTSVVLASGAVASDIVEIIVYDTFAVANFYNRTDSDSRYVNIDGDTMTGNLKLKSTASTYEGLELITPSGDGSGEFHIGVHQDGSTSGRALHFRRGGSDGMDTLSASIDASGNVGVGTDSMAAKFVVQDSSLPKIESNYNGSKHLDMGNGASGCGFAMTTGHFMTFNHQPFANRGTDTNLTERLRILSGGGITFNGDTATANALDDYEEGTYTPSLSISGSTSGISINSSNGTYTKIGRLVVVTLRINLDSKGSNSGRITASLPFGCQNASVQHGAAAVYYLFNFSALTDGNVGFSAETNLAQGGLFHTTTGSDLTGDTNINNNSQFAVTISYVTN